MSKRDELADVLSLYAHHDIDYKSTADAVLAWLASDEVIEAMAIGMIEYDNPDTGLGYRWADQTKAWQNHRINRLRAAVAALSK